MFNAIRSTDLRYHALFFLSSGLYDGSLLHIQLPLNELEDFIDQADGVVSERLKGESFGDLHNRCTDEEYCLPFIPVQG